MGEKKMREGDVGEINSNESCQLQIQTLCGPFAHPFPILSSPLKKERKKGVRFG